MLTKLLALLWIVLGVVWFIWPHLLRNRLKRKMSRKIKWAIFILTFIFGVHLLGVAFRMPGFLAKVAGLFGVMLLIKGVLLMTTQLLEKIAERIVTFPVEIIRLWATGCVVAGWILLSL